MGNDSLLEISSVIKNEQDISSFAECANDKPFQSFRPQKDIFAYSADPSVIMSLLLSIHGLPFCFDFWL